MDDSQIRKKAKVAIKELAKDFLGGNRAFFFRNESDIQCRLFRRLTQKGIPVDLVHAEYGMYWDEKAEIKRRGAIDIVVWRPERKNDAIELWGKSHLEFSRQMPDILAVAIEIGYFYGADTSTRQKFETIRGLQNDPDIQKLIKVADGGTDAYLMIFWDHDVNDDTDASTSRSQIRQALRRLCRKYSVKSILVSRDDKKLRRIGFR